MYFIAVFVLILLLETTMANTMAKSTNLTDITWAHAVNSGTFLAEVLKSKKNAYNTSV